MTAVEDLAAALVGLSQPGRPESCFGVLRAVSRVGTASSWQVTVDVSDLPGLIVRRELWGSAFIASVATGADLVGRTVLVRFVVGSRGTRQPVVEYLVGD